MLRYGILGIIIAVSLLLSSCENGGAELDCFSAEKHTATIVENENDLYFDENEKSWMVRRLIPKLFSTFGGGADVIFNGDDGKVVAMWGNK